MDTIKIYITYSILYIKKKQKKINKKYLQQIFQSVYLPIFFLWRRGKSTYQYWIEQTIHHDDSIAITPCHATTISDNLASQGQINYVVKMKPETSSELDVRIE